VPQQKFEPNHFRIQVRRANLHISRTIILAYNGENLKANLGKHSFKIACGLLECDAVQNIPEGSAGSASERKID
jgi:hypothetical protein